MKSPTTKRTPVAVSTPLDAGPREPALRGPDAVVALAALAQETRLAIYRLLVEFAPEGRTPGAIAETLALAPATLSFHLKELARAGLVTPHRDGRNLWYRAELAAMNRLLSYLTEHCCQGRGALAAGDTCATSCDPVCKPKPRS